MKGFGHFTCVRNITRHLKSFIIVLKVDNPLYTHMRMLKIKFLNFLDYSLTLIS